MTASARPRAQRRDVTDLVWDRMREEARQAAVQEPQFSTLLHANVLDQHRFEDALTYRLSQRFHHADVPAETIRHTFYAALDADPAIGLAIRADLQAIVERDPATTRYLEALLYLKGFHALTIHRLAHWLWRQDRHDFALYLQSRSSELLQIDIHPAASLGRGLFLDHGTGIVIGQTSIIEDDVSILQSVTLGGSGTQARDRHPTVRRGVLIGSGAKLIGHIEIGAGARIGAGSVVTDSVPAHKTVVGIPARIVGDAGSPEPGRSMNQIFFDVGL